MKKLRSFHSALEQDVQHRLELLGFSPEPGERIGGYEPDFVITTDDGRKVIIEVKGWRGNRAHIERAIHQVALYKKALGADAGYVVLPDLKEGKPNEGVLALDDLTHLSDLIGQQELKAKPRRIVAEPAARLTPSLAMNFATSKRPADRIVFAAMPYSPDFDDVYMFAMTRAAEAVGAVCKRMDHEEFSGDVMVETKRLIRTSIAVIADVSGNNPNVLYELGFAEGLGKPTVPITHSPLADLPFDVNHEKVSEYVVGRTHKFIDPLTRRLKSVVGTR